MLNVKPSSGRQGKAKQSGEPHMSVQKANGQRRSLGSPKTKLLLQQDSTRQTKSLASEMGNMSKANLRERKYEKSRGNH